MRTGLPAACLRATPSAIRDDRFTRCPFPAATTMPLWLWQEVQILPWSTEIVALTCGTRKRLRPVVPAQARQACCATPVQNQKVGQLPPSLNFNFLTLRGGSATLSVTDDCRGRGGDGTTMELGVPAR